MSKSNCARCGRALTEREIHYYGATCETCEGQQFHADEATEGQPPSKGWPVPAGIITQTREGGWHVVSLRTGDATAAAAARDLLSALSWLRLSPQADTLTIAGRRYSTHIFRKLAVGASEDLLQLVDGGASDAVTLRSWTVRNLPKILAEVDRATAKFPTWPDDVLHAIAVLGEEFGELTKAALQLTYEPQKTSAEDLATEAIQTAAMALRFAMSLGRYRFLPSTQHSQAEGP